MTGFGKASLQLPSKKITVEIKSLNSKGLDLNNDVMNVINNKLTTETYNFKDLFPISLSTVQFNSKESDINYVTASVQFKYSIYDIVVL